jgi:FkbM family methyltransferase
MCDKKLFTTYQFDTKERLGVNQDGGYVIGVLDGSYDCYISAGVSNEESFSRDFIRKYKMKATDCFAFDGTINAYPTHYTTDIAFIRKNINSFNDATNTTLVDLIDSHHSVFIKMDIEGWEYTWLKAIPNDTLRKVKQLVIEVHGIIDTSVVFVEQLKNVTFDMKNESLAKLADTHYLIHAHYNTCTYKQNNERYAIELTYVNKSCIPHPKLNSTPLPINGLDYPNHSGTNDDMSFPPFVWNE